MKNKKSSLFYFLLMHAGFLIYAFYAILGKTASKKEFLSPAFILIYLAVFVILFMYALIWQQVLKMIPLLVATANKTVTIVWGIVFGKIFFGEQIKMNMIIGAALILLGILLLATENIGEKKDELKS